jgi:uncharacterized membrane protein
MAIEVASGGSRNRLIALYALTLAGTAVWLAMIMLAPYAASGAGRAAPFLYSIFAPVCHQRPERCFYLFGFPLAVCARCFGIYLGILAGLGWYPFGRGFSVLRPPSLRTFILVSLPIGLDAAGIFLRFWNTANGVRFLTGLVWGMILPFFFLTGVGELVTGASLRRLASRRRNN